MGLRHIPKGATGTATLLSTPTPPRVTPRFTVMDTIRPRIQLVLDWMVSEGGNYPQMLEKCRIKPLL